MAGKASIHALPTEIKTRIAELCHLQDETIRNVFARLRHHVATAADGAGDEEEEGLSKLGPSAEDRSGPKSLLSLSCVSREWRDNAVKILLRKVTTHQCSEPIFLFAIAPQYGHLVEELDMRSWPEGCSSTNILLSLAYLSNVHKVALPSIGRVCVQLVKRAHVSNFPVEFASPAYVVRALRRVVQHAQDVILSVYDLGSSMSCVRGAGLTTLELVPRREDLPAMLETIHTCPNLRTLKITAHGYKKSTFMDAASLPYPPHPTLHRLEILDQSGGGGLHDFIHRFFPNLEELDMFLCSGDAPETISPLDFGHFALSRLRLLTVYGDWTFSAPLVRHISPSTFPALQTCTWVLPYGILSNLRAAYAAAAVETIGHLRDHQVNRAVPLHFKIDFAREKDRAELRPMLEALGITNGVEPGGGVVVGFEPAFRIDNGFSDPPDQILTPELCRTDETKVEDLGKIISTSLDRIRDLKDAAVAVEDRFQMSRIAQALQEGEWLCVERQC